MIKNLKSKIKNYPRGFTLVELLIVISIIVILAIILVGIFNPIQMFNRARDAQRKKDLARIKIGFEEYFNDNGCYPNNSLISDLNSAANCKSTTVFSNWLSIWPCDPDSKPYLIVAEGSNCNKWYKVLTQLQNTNDSSIPMGWTNLDMYVIGKDVTSKMVNYGISSTNINWFDKNIDAECALWGGCYYKPDPVDQPNVCNSAGIGCVGPNCFIGMCRDSCVTTCCGAGCH